MKQVTPQGPIPTDFRGLTLTNVGAPASSGDAATKTYADGVGGRKGATALTAASAAGGEQGDLATTQGPFIMLSNAASPTADSTWRLPAASASAGYWFIVQRGDANGKVVYLGVQSGESFNDTVDATRGISAKREAYLVWCDGSGWFWKAISHFASFPNRSGVVPTISNPGYKNADYTGTLSDTLIVVAKGTTIAAGSNGAVLPQATISVASTTGFASTGTLKIKSSTGWQTVTYTGKTSTSFTGCSGGGGTLSTGQNVVPSAVTITMVAAPSDSVPVTVIRADPSDSPATVTVVPHAGDTMLNPPSGDTTASVRIPAGGARQFASNNTTEWVCF